MMSTRARVLSWSLMVLVAGAGGAAEREVDPAVTLPPLEAPLPGRLARPALPADRLWSKDLAVRRSLGTHPALVAARRRLEMAEGLARSRSAAEAPTLQLGASLVPHPDAVLSPARSRLLDTDQSMLSVTLPTSGRRTHTVRAAAAALEAARQELQVAERDRTAAVLRAYVDVQEATLGIEVHEHGWAVAEAFAELSERQLEQGAAPESHVTRSRVERARAEQQLVQAQGELKARWAQLAFQVLGSAEVPLGASDAMRESFAAPDRATLMAAAIAARPEARRALAQLRSLEAEVGVARSARRPDLFVRSSFTDQLTNTGNPPLAASFSLPLWDSGRVGGEVARARAAVAEARELLTLTQGQIGLEAAQAFERAVAAARALEVCQRDVVPPTRTLLERARLAYVSGAGTVMEVLDAQRVYRQAGLEHAKARADLERAIIDLNRATGRDL